MAMSGVDIDGLMSFANRIRARAQAIESIVIRLDPVVRELNWTGTDRDRFVAEWEQFHRSRIRQLVHDLLNLATGLSQHARRQENASRTGGGGGI